MYRLLNNTEKIQPEDELDLIGLCELDDKSWPIYGIQSNFLYKLVSEAKFFIGKSVKVRRLIENKVITNKSNNKSIFNLRK